MADVNLLSADADTVRALERLLADARRRPQNTTQRPRTDWEEGPAPEVYVARTPPAGIDPLDQGENIGTGTGAGPTADDVPGFADLDIYRLVEGTTPSLAPLGIKRTVYNLSTRPVAGSQWALIERDKLGRWFVPPAPVPGVFRKDSDFSLDNNHEDGLILLDASGNDILVTLETVPHPKPIGYTVTFERVDYDATYYPATVSAADPRYAIGFSHFVEGSTDEHFGITLGPLREKGSLLTIRKTASGEWRMIGFHQIATRRSAGIVTLGNNTGAAQQSLPGRKRLVDGNLLMGPEDYSGQGGSILWSGRGAAIMGGLSVITIAVGDIFENFAALSCPGATATAGQIASDPAFFVIAGDFGTPRYAVDVDHVRHYGITGTIPAGASIDVVGGIVVGSSLPVTPTPTPTGTGTGAGCHQFANAGVTVCPATCWPDTWYASFTHYGGVVALAWGGNGWYGSLCGATLFLAINGDGQWQLTYTCGGYSTSTTADVNCYSLTIPSMSLTTGGTCGTHVITVNISASGTPSSPDCTGSGTGGDVTTECCSGAPLPPTLTLTLTVSGVTIGSIPLVWDGSAWSASGSLFPACGITSLSFTCNIENTFRIVVGGSTTLDEAGPATSCSPFSWTITGVTASGACGGVPVDITVTE